MKLLAKGKLLESGIQSPNIPAVPSSNNKRLGMDAALDYSSFMPNLFQEMSGSPTTLWEPATWRVVSIKPHHLFWREYSSSLAFWFENSAVTSGSSAFKELWEIGWYITYRGKKRGHSYSSALSLLIHHHHMFSYYFDNFVLFSASYACSYVPKTQKKCSIYIKSDPPMCWVLISSQAFFQYHQKRLIRKGILVWATINVISEVLIMKILQVKQVVIFSLKLTWHFPLSLFFRPFTKLELSEL